MNRCKHESFSLYIIHVHTTSPQSQCNEGKGVHFFSSFKSIQAASKEHAITKQKRGKREREIFFLQNTVANPRISIASMSFLSQSCVFLGLDERGRLLLVECPLVLEPSPVSGDALDLFAVEIGDCKFKC